MTASQSSRPLLRRLWYASLKVVIGLLFWLLFRLRKCGAEHLPSHGPVLVLANHQSHLDPILVGLAAPRQLHFLARESLFRQPLFAWLIRSLNAIPVDREGSGLGGLKQTLKMLRQEQAVLIFPEGTRTRDGARGALRPGFCAVARRGQAYLVPAGIEGAFEAWPRQRRFPRPARIGVCLGPPLSPSEVAQLTDDALIQELSRRIDACREVLATNRSRRQPVAPDSSQGPHQL